MNTFSFPQISVKYKDADTKLIRRILPYAAALRANVAFRDSSPLTLA